MKLTKTQQRRNDKLDTLTIGNTATFNALKGQTPEQVAQWARNRLRSLKAKGQNYRTRVTDSGVLVTRLKKKR